MQLTVMAWRSLNRNRRRTFITAFSIAFGIFLAVTFTGSGDYSYTSMINTSAVMGFGHVTIAARGYNDRPSLARWVPDGESLRARAAGVADVEAAFARIMGQAMFAAGARNAGGMFLAIDPARETGRYNFFLRSIEEGKLFADSDGRGAVVGAVLAEKLNLRIGKKLIVTVTDRTGELTSELLRVSGVFRTGDEAVDASMVLAPLARMRGTLRYGEQGASFVAAYVDDLRRVERTRARLESKAASPGVEVLSWKETQRDLSGLISVDRLFNYLMQLLVGMVIAAGIMNTMQMSVLERSREFGIMMAVGMAPGQVVRQVLIESFWLGCLGMVLGVAMTAPWFWYMHTHGIDLGAFVGDDYSAGGVLVDPVMKLRLYRESAFFILLAVFALTMAASVFPAVRAGRIMPVETLKEM